MKALLTAVLVTLTIAVISGRDVQLKGNAPGAAGKFIEVYNQPDPLTGKNILIEKVRVGEDEKFIISIDCDSICWIRLRHGIYEFLLLIEAKDRQYELELPAYRAIPKEEKLNPFFQYKIIHIRLNGEANLNNVIRHIDSLYYDYTNMVTESIYLGEKLPDQDSLLQSFSDVEKSLEGEYALQYFKYRYSVLKIISGKHRIHGSEDIDLINKSFFPLMPAYTDLVKQVFNGYLGRLANNKKTSPIRGMINSAESYRDIVKLIMEQKSIRDTSLLEFVLLDNLYSEYYKGGFRKESIEEMFSWISHNATHEYNRWLAAFIIIEVQKLKPGNCPPGFTLSDSYGNVISLDSLRGKFSILAFGTTELTETRHELDILNNWVNDYKDKLQVVIIILDENFQLALEQAGYRKYDFIFLDGSASDKLLDDYNIRYLPSFYFLDRETRLIFSPALMPSENLRSLVIPELGESFVDDR